MIPRRDLVTGGVLGSVLGGLASGEAAAAPAAGQSQVSEQWMGQIARAIADLRSEIRSQRTFPEIAAIRESQKRFLVANARLPAFIDVGADVWFGVHDWHVRWQQPMAISRDSLGRLTIVLMQTVVILRADSLASFIGLPYDAQ